MPRMPVVLVVALLFGCSHGRWKSEPAQRPLSRAELGTWNLTVAPAVDALGEPDGGARELRDALAQELDREGFKLVGHPAYHHDLTVQVKVEPAEGKLFAVAQLTTDGFYVAYAEEAVQPESLRDPAALQALAGRLGETLARSEGLASFVRNSAVPEQDACTQ